MAQAYSAGLMVTENIVLKKERVLPHLKVRSWLKKVTSSKLKLLSLKPSCLVKWFLLI